MLFYYFVKFLDNKKPVILTHILCQFQKKY